ncbi:MAG: helix-turn-helix transcriptional regulator [Alphaproteobacteria bacterium]|nr:helix-turn-helix transcriptional regulator [Alphaproteobacteria bacterium]
MSRAEMASFLGVSYQQIHKYESGISHIPLNHIHSISQKFDLDYDIFFEASEHENWENQLSQKITSLPEHISRKRVIKSIRALVDS